MSFAEVAIYMAKTVKNNRENLLAFSFVISYSWYLNTLIYSTCCHGSIIAIHKTLIAFCYLSGILIEFKIIGA